MITHNYSKSSITVPVRLRYVHSKARCAASDANLVTLRRPLLLYHMFRGRDMALNQRLVTVECLIDWETDA